MESYTVDSGTAIPTVITSMATTDVRADPIVIIAA